MLGIGADRVVLLVRDHRTGRALQAVFPEGLGHLLVVRDIPGKQRDFHAVVAGGLELGQKGKVFLCDKRRP